MLLFSACAFEAGQDVPPPGSYTYSFENDMEGWVPNGVDLDNPPVEWSIERSDELASDGDISLKLYLNNVNDAGKIWAERTYEVQPNQSIRVNIEYDFASSDWGDLNLWRIIAGVHQTLPKSADMLNFQEDTGIDSSADTGYEWLHKDYSFNVNSGEDGSLTVVIGVWGNWETLRNYYIDNVKVTFSSESEDPAPPAPSNLRVEREKYDPGEDKYGDKLFLTWAPVSVPDLKEYRIYRSLERIGGEDGLKTPFQMIAATMGNEYTDTNLNVTEEYPTTVYYYYVAAVDEAGNDSEPSEEVSIEYTPFG
jgi:hypothetical protein